MFSFAHVILPFSEIAPADAITGSLARFRMGGRGDVPEEWLQFDDDTAHVEELYRASITFTKGDGLSIAGADSWYFSIGAITDEMERRGKSTWRICFVDIEPTVASFAEHYLRTLDRHPVTGGFGHWRNPLGRWDWWDLGGRFDGVITDTARHPGRAQSRISSGSSRGRDVLARIEHALAEALQQEPPPEVDVISDSNVELVNRLLQTLNTNEKSHLPSALALPPDALDHSSRWVRN